MKRALKVVGLIISYWIPCLATSVSPCVQGPLTAYVTGGLNLCGESGGITIAFNQNLLIPSYAGLNLLSTNNSAAAPSAITVVPGSPGLDFQSSTFKEITTLIIDPLASQAELVQFDVMSSGSFISTTFSLSNTQVSAGAIGAGVAIGQELVCVGGDFTSLPVGLVTSVANGVLAQGTLGCNGTTLVGTAGFSVGLLSAVTSLVGLPNFTGLTDTATIQLSPYNATKIDVIKIQALLGVAGGSAQTTAFGDTFSAAAPSTPEPASLWACAIGLALISVSRAKVSSKFRNLGRPE